MSKLMMAIEKQEGRPIRQVLIDLFAEYGNQVKVAQKLNISQSTLSIWLLKLDLEQRTVLVEREAQR